MSKKRDYIELIKNTGVLAVGNFSSKILVFFLVPIYTKVLSTEDYGFYELVLSSIQLFFPIITLNVTDGLLRFTLEKRNQIKEIVRISNKYIILGSCLCAVYLLITKYLNPVSIISSYYIYIFFLYIFYGANQYLIQLSKGMDRVKEMAISGILGTITIVTTCLLFLFPLSMGLKGFFLSNILGQLIPTLYLAKKLDVITILQHGPKTSKELEKRLLKYSIPLILTSIGWWINNTSDRYITSFFLGVSATGILSIAYKIPNILSVIHGLFIQAWQISAIKQFNQIDKESFYTTVFNILSISLYYIATLLILFTVPIAKIMFSENFFSGWPYVPLLIVSSCYTGVAGYISPILTSAFNTKCVAASTIVGGIINIVISVILVQVIDIYGVVIGTLVSSFTIMIYRYNGLNGEIESSAFKMSMIIWIALVIQAVLVLSGQYLVQIGVITLVSIVYRKQIRYYLNICLENIRR